MQTDGRCGDGRLGENGAGGGGRKQYGGILSGEFKMQSFLS